MAKKKSKARPKKSKAKAKPAKKKIVRRAAAKAKPVKTKKSKKSKKPVKAAARPAKKVAKKPAKKKKQTMGEGSYEATRAFDKDQTNFVKRNKDKIPALAKAAEAALDGPEGDSLREAEATAADRSRDTF